MPLEAPQTQGDLLPQSDVLGHTMIVCPTEWIEHIPTKNTKPGEKSPAIRVHVADFHTDPHNPTIYRDVLWFGVIQGPLRRQIGKFLASRMGQGQATQGNNPPWQLKSVLDEADWAAFLGNWLDGTEAGKAFTAECEQAVALAAANPTTTAAEASAPAPAAPAPAAPPPPPTVTAPAAAAPPPPPAPAAAPVAAPAPNAAAGIEALIAAMPPDQQAAARAVLANQANAAH